MRLQYGDLIFDGTGDGQGANARTSSAAFNEPLVTLNASSVSTVAEAEQAVVVRAIDALAPLSDGSPNTPRASVSQTAVRRDSSVPRSDVTLARRIRPRPSSPYPRLSQRRRRRSLRGAAALPDAQYQQQLLSASDISDSTGLAVAQSPRIIHSPNLDDRLVMFPSYSRHGMLQSFAAVDTSPVAAARRRSPLASRSVEQSPPSVRSRRRAVDSPQQPSGTRTPHLQRTDTPSSPSESNDDQESRMDGGADLD